MKPKTGRNISIIAKLSQEGNKRVVVTGYLVIETKKTWFSTRRYLLGEFSTPAEAIRHINKLLGFE